MCWRCLHRAILGAIVSREVSRGVWNDRSGGVDSVYSGVVGLFCFGVSILFGERSSPHSGYFAVVVSISRRIRDRLDVCCVGVVEFGHVDADCWGGSCCL